MTKSEMFKRAHQIARKLAKEVGNYSIAFKLALKKVWAEEKASELSLDEYQATQLLTSTTDVMPTIYEEGVTEKEVAGVKLTVDDIKLAYELTAMAALNSKPRLRGKKARIEHGRAEYAWLYYLIGKKADQFVPRYGFE